MTNEFLINFWYFALALVWGIYIFQEAFISGGSFLAFFIKDDEVYEQLNRTIGTHWDGIQVWLILAVGGLFAAFPTAFGDLLSSLYIPMFLLMYVIIIRGLSIELIYKTDDLKMRNVLKKALAFASVGLVLVVGIYLQTQFVGTPVNDEFFSFLAIFKLQNLKFELFSIVLIFSSFPLLKLSTPITCISFFKNSLARLEPMKPQTPLIKIAIIF